MKVGLMRVLFAAIAVAIARAEELPSEVEELRAEAIASIDQGPPSEGEDFLKLATQLGDLGDYDFLGVLLQRAMTGADPGRAQILVRRVLEAPTGTELKPDLSEALIDYIDFLLRDTRPGDEIATGRRLVSHRIAVVLEGGLGISSSEFDYEKPPVALKYIDEAKQVIARLRREGGVCRITEEVQGSRSHHLARESIIARDEARASGGQREERRDPRERDKLSPAKEIGTKAGQEELGAGTKWGIGFGVAILGAWCPQRPGAMMACAEVSWTLAA
ncbi:hypothetical protein [Luteolibacter luteus]|uniref:HEAT repeat domain-containing protein n=1 Tax=Luteolibacter luteus TaxID=2728835 RepID=A0A858RKQ6_9BACT|nr:hypothetical protein [Luteolibacter luteus]QJE97325.1 hypothetical protein HHL09_16525 [Luteolibacter luteus]